MPSTADIEHLLRRTEFVARPNRVSELTSKPSLDACVDDVLAVLPDPGSMNFTEMDNWQRGDELVFFWLDRMAFDSPRPLQEKMAFFWHGHFCTSLRKIELAQPLKDQIDLFRRSGLGNLRTLATQMSIQPAMLRYLDNDQNNKTSPNQNFARELMELFLLGVGNYTEADVQAATAAWTGHSDVWETGQYVWRGDWHDSSTKQFLGRTINSGGDATKHGAETIDVIMSTGVVPSGADVNMGRPTREICAEFITRKLWTFFAGTDAPDAVVAALRSVAISSNFEIRPWLRALLLRPEFYAADVRQGLVRSPVDMIVAYMSATGIRASKTTCPVWWMEGMGQRPLVPPDVSGWRHNQFYVSAAAMGNRSLAARYYMWNAMAGFWDGDGLLRLGGGTVSRAEFEAHAALPDQLVDLLLARMRVDAGPASRDVLYRHARNQQWFERLDLVALILLMPEFHVA